MLSYICFLTLALAYDYNQLRINWKPTQCITRKCVQGYESTDFGIHGLWPEQFDGGYPSFCSDMPFSISLDTELLLTTYWNSYKKSPGKFWKHEWDKHGTCFYPATAPNNYFSIAIYLMLEADLLTSLSVNNITASDEKKYSPRLFAISFPRVVGNICFQKGNTYYLSSVSLCYSLEMDWIDCPTKLVQCKNDFMLNKAKT